MRVVVDELRRGLVVRAEGELRLLLRVEVEPEQLLVAADARVVDEELAVGRVGRRRSRRSRRREVDDLLGLEIDGVDVADAAAQRRERDRPAVGREARRLRLVHRLHRDAHLRSSASARSGRSACAPSRCARSRRAGRPSATTTSTASSSNRSPSCTMWSKPMSLSKPLVRLRTIEPSFDEIEDDVELAVLAVDGDGGDQIARRRRRDRQRLGVVRSSPGSAPGRGRSRPAAPCRGTA